MLYAQNSAPTINIIPAPAALATAKGNFTVKNGKTILLATSEEARKIAALFRDFMARHYGMHLPLTIQQGKAGAKNQQGTILFSIREQATPREGYTLIATPSAITLEAGEGAGLFYAMQSLTQLLPAGRTTSVQIPAISIKDHPRFAYRGLHLDVGRHFFPVSFIKKYIDLMAQYKYNTFHWHLTEDQGWRIEIKKYPKLTEIGSKRKETIVDKNFNPYKGDGIPYGGYYTQDEVREVVKYAQERYITVVPEIEMPGHSLAALAAYPELSCTGGPFEVGTKWGVFEDVYCAGKEQTFQFLENVLDEVLALFPSKYIHIGGDECPKTRWKTCPYCQKRIKDLGLKDEHELQSYFIQRIEKYLNSKGRNIIGWDEILEGGLAPNATVMSWRGEEGGIAAAKQHHNVVMTPGTYVYLDHGQGDPKREPLNIGAYLPLEKVYSYNPTPNVLNEEEKQYIRGAQGNVWTEYMKTPEKVEYMVYPRALALAEVVWTPVDQKDYRRFLERLPYHLKKLDEQKIHFRIPEPLGLQDTTVTSNSFTLRLHSLVPGSKIYYTTNGSDPTTESAVYHAPLNIPLKTGDSVLINAIVTTPSGNKSVVYSARLTSKAKD